MSWIKKKKSNEFIDAIKRSAIAEHLVNNQSFAKSFNLKISNTVKSCYNVFDLFKMEAIWI